MPLYITNEATYKLAKELIDKLAKQMNPQEHELIVVDDGAPYRFYNPVRKYIYIRLSKNKGAAAARNVGLNHATGDFVAFVDADDMVADNFFELLDEAAEKDADITYFKVNCEDDSVAYREPCAWGKLVKRSYIGDRRFDEDQLIGEEDTLFLPLQKEKPPKIERIDKVLYYYRWSANPDSLMKRYWRGDIQRRK